MRFALAALLLFVGCSHPSEVHHPVVGFAGWHELRSAHFTLRTDLAPSDARAALAEFERTYVALEALAFADDPPRDPIDVVDFSDELQFAKLAPTGAAGYFMPRQASDPDPEPTIVISGRMLVAGTLEETTERRFRHELVHRFLDHHVRNSPPWLQEGLAEFYSTLKIDHGAAVVGTLPNQKVLRIDIHLISSLVQGLAEDRVDLKALPSVTELLQTDYQSFHQPKRELPNYAGSWLFVHMLMNGPHHYRERFMRYLDGLAAGHTNTRAWHDSFGDITLARLDDELRRYATKPEMDQRVLTVRALAPAPVEEERPMSAGELHLLWARVRPWDSREDIWRSGEDLLAARALMGDHPTAELHFWSALYAERWRRFDEAERELRAALAMAPHESRYWLGLCELLDRGDRDAPPDAEALPTAVAQLEPLAHTARALDFLARYYSAHQTPDAGLPFARRAVATEHGCWECADTLATLNRMQRATLQPPRPDSFQPAPAVYWPRI